MFPIFRPPRPKTAPPPSPSWSRRRPSTRRLQALVPIPPAPFPPERDRRQEHRRRHGACDYHPRARRPQPPPQARPAETQIRERVRGVPHDVVVPRRVQAVRPGPIPEAPARPIGGAARAPGLAAAGFGQGRPGGRGRGARASAVLDRFQGMRLWIIFFRVRQDEIYILYISEEEKGHSKAGRKVRNSHPSRACTSSRAP